MRKDKLPLKIKIISAILIAYLSLRRFDWRSKAANFKNISPCIYALWHGHQIGLYGLPDKRNISALISQSNDGEIINAAARAMNFAPSIRGSHNRGGAKASLNVIEKLESGRNVAITIDGPKGPARKVKPGILKIAQLAQVPIIPLVWYSPAKSWIKFPSWDGFRFAVGFIKSLILLGEPIYIQNDITEEKTEEYRLKLENALLDLYQDAKQNFEKYMNDKESVKSRWN